MRVLRSSLILSLTLLATGCSPFSHIPAELTDGEALEIDWRKDFEQARADAAASGKPILMVAGAGDLAGSC